MNSKTDISAAYVGSTGVDKLCLGNEVVWQSTPPTPVPYEQQYFTVEANEAGTFYVRSENFNFSKNGGPWTSGVGNTAMTLSQGDKVRFKHETNSAYKGMFSGNTMSFQVYGNIESMEYGNNFSGQTRINVPSAFTQYFLSSTGLTSAENLILPATTLAMWCYTSLFRGCASLATAPSLPATTLASGCYQKMFAGCTSLTTAPELPATTLANICYQNMFDGCTSLTTAPELPATTLARYCYSSMFDGCTSLNTITCLATDMSATFCLNNWVRDVAATGTFYKDPSATGWTTGDSGIPVGWTVQTYVDPSTPVLKIAGQSITGTSTSGTYEWEGLAQYSGTSFTIEVLGVPITADTWDYYEYYIDECGEPSEITYETGTTRSVFEANSGYISVAAYLSSNNRVVYESADDNTSDDPETICTCQGGCWDGETCQECHQSCEDQGLCDDGEGNCVECGGDPCEDWEGAGFSSWEECECAQGLEEYCEEPTGDPCDDYEGAGYSTYEECMCAEHGEGCDPCDDWENMGYASYEDCTCQERGEGCESDDICENFGVLGYETWDECMCAEHGENCPEEESGE